MRADLTPIGPRQTQVSFSAEITGLTDPFNFTTKAIQLFEQPFKDRIAKLQLPEEKLLTSNPSDQAISVADEIRKLATLKAEGIISEDEFRRKKSKLLES